MTSSGQAQLPGFGTEPVATDRLFFAVLPDADAARRIAEVAGQLRAAHGLQGHSLGVGRFHVTLNFLGDHAGRPTRAIALASRLADAVKVAPIEVRFDRVGGFRRRGRAPLVLLGDAGVEGLVALQKTLHEALAPARLERGPSRYTPHLTLLYDERKVTTVLDEPIAWTAHEFVLVHSAIGQSRHTVLGRWPLRG